MKLTTIQQTLKEKEILIFTPLDLQRFLKISKTAAQKLVERYTKKGIFIRLRKGYYAMEDRIPHSFFIANCIYKPSYISFESALSYYGMIPESIYSVISATSKATRNFKVMKKDFHYIKIKKEAYTGYRKKEVNKERVLIAEPEKALADYFYLASLGKKRVSERLTTKGISQEKLFDYLKLFKRKNLKEFSLQYL